MWGGGGREFSWRAAFSPFAASLPAHALFRRRFCGEPHRFAKCPAVLFRLYAWFCTLLLYAVKPGTSYSNSYTGVEKQNRSVRPHIPFPYAQDMIDDALLRPGRLEVHVEIGLPDEAGRVQILKIHTKGMVSDEAPGKDG